jgi:hypothetical protein
VGVTVAFDGATTAATIVIESEVVAKPTALVAVTTQFTAAATVVGVPVITPVDVLSVKPAGSGGATEYDATAPPVDEGAFAVIAVPAGYDAGFGK